MKPEKALINKDFVSDIYNQKMLFGITVRSEIHKGKIESINIPELKKGITAVSYKDIPGKNELEVFGNKMPFLAETEIEYYGQPILLICGPDKDELDKIKKIIKIKYIKEKPVFNLDEAGEVKLLTFSTGDAINEINIADKVIEKEYNTPPQGNSYLETQNAYTEPDNGTIIVYSSTAYPYHVRDNVSSITGLSKNKVRVIALENAGSSNEKIIFPSLLAGHCALLSFLTKKPVKMEYTRNEDTVFTPKRHAGLIRYKTGLNKNNMITGMAIKIKLDSGAFQLISPIVLERTVIACAGAYSCENISITAYIYKTNKIPTAYFSGMGEPQAFFSLELHTQIIARKCGMDPCTWKVNNLTRQSLPIGQKLKNKKMPFNVLEDVVNRSDFIRKYGAYEFNRKQRKNIFSSNILKKGIGISLNFHGIGIPNSNISNLNYSIRTVLDENNKFHIFTSIINKDEHNIYRHIASGILKLPLSSIIIEKCDTSVVPDSGPPVCSQSIFIIGKLLIQCCNTTKTKAEKGKLPIEIRKSFNQKKAYEWTGSKLKNNPYMELAWEATVVEVEIDPVLLKPVIIGIWISFFAGDEVFYGQYRKIIDRDLINNLEFSIRKYSNNPYMGISSILNIKEVFPSKVSFIDSNIKSSSIKLIGLGDQAVTGFAPAYLGAVSQATGLEINNIPVYPELIELLFNKEEKKGKSNEN